MAVSAVLLALFVLAANTGPRSLLTAVLIFDGLLITCFGLIPSTNRFDVADALREYSLRLAERRRRIVGNVVPALNRDGRFLRVQTAVTGIFAVVIGIGWMVGGISRAF